MTLLIKISVFLFFYGNLTWLFNIQSCKSLKSFAVFTFNRGFSLREVNFELSLAGMLFTAVLNDYTVITGTQRKANSFGGEERASQEQRRVGNGCLNQNGRSFLGP